MTDNVPMVTISAARLAELEEAEKRLAKRNHSNLERLRAYREANPEKVAALNAESSKRYKEAHREQYNARRRELRRLKKEAAAAMEGCVNAATAPSETPRH